MVKITVGLVELRRWLVRRNLSQLAVASLLEITSSACSLLINGRTRPSLDTAAAIERITGGAVTLGSWARKHDGQLPRLPERRGRKRARKGGNRCV